MTGFGKGARDRRVIEGALLFLAMVTLFGVLHVMSDIAAPLLLALVAAIVLAPMNDKLARIGLPGSVAAFVTLTGLMAFVASLALFAEPYIWRISAELPKIRYELRSLLSEAQGIFHNIESVNEEMNAALGNGSDGVASENDDAPDLPSLTDAILLAPAIMAQMIIFVAALYFLLVSRISMYGALAHWMGGAAGTASVRARLTSAETLVSRYFLAITLVNAALGLMLALALSLLGLPLPLAWGALAMILNYVVYIGPALVALGLLLSGIVNFSGGMAVAPAAAFLILNMAEAQFVTPAFVGRSMALNPLLVFVSIVFWIWFWGPVGGIIAIPVLLIAMALANHPATEVRAVKPVPG